MKVTETLEIQIDQDTGNLVLFDTLGREPWNAHVIIVRKEKIKKLMEVINKCHDTTRN